MLCDISNSNNQNKGTIPADILVTPLIPDIVLIREDKNTCDIWELTVPFETNIRKQHEYKQNKYSHFLTDITSHKCTVSAFVIGARGYISTDKRNRLQTFYHTYCKKDIKLSQFLSNVSGLSLLSSYYIYNCRTEPTWSTPNYLKPTFK